MDDLKNKTLHDSWLSYWSIISSKFPGDLKGMIEPYIQGSFYSGAFAAVQDDVNSKEQLWRMCESGISDACGRPGMRMTNSRGETYSESLRKKSNG